MDHEQFELEAGGDPQHLSAEAAAHAASCPSCAQLHAELLALDAKLGRVLAIPVPAKAAPSLPVVRRVWPYGLAAAAALATVMVGTFLVGVPREALAHAVVFHADHEAKAFTMTEPMASADVAAVLSKAHVSLLPGGPDVMYAAACQFRGHVIPHFAVHATHGNAVVLVLPDEQVKRRQEFSEAGYHGVLVPASHGAIAIVSTGAEDLDEIVSAVAERIRYLD